MLEDRITELVQNCIRSYDRLYGEAP